MLPVCCVQGAVQGSGGCCTSLPQERSSSYQSINTFPISRESSFSLAESPCGAMWGEVATGNIPNLWEGAMESMKWAEGSRGPAHLGLLFFVKQCLHFIWRKACPARGSTAKLSSSRPPGHSMWKQSRGQEFYIMHKKRDGGRTAVTCCTNHEL